ncbi:hypothetical protein [Micromonospora echinaurantiaca]|uniref:hypothetical protein n=1 Tax=Micromonospora echinaurantiaca TaxID=47857 RepID=UPI00343FB06D
MSDMVIAEFRKLLGLPAALVAIAISVLGTLGFAALSAISMRAALKRGDTARFTDQTTAGAGLDLLPVGAVGAIVLGVVIISSEYTSNRDDAGGGRQISTTLTSTPRRSALLAAKVTVVTVTTGALAAFTVSGAIMVSHTLLGEYGHPLGDLVDRIGWRVVGSVVYLVLTALLACAVTVLTRSGVIPLAFLIANTSLVSVSLLLTRVTGLARYLPDVAGAQMVSANYPAQDMLGPIAGGLVMAAWTVVMLAVAAVVFTRRDA